MTRGGGIISRNTVNKIIEEKKKNNIMNLAPNNNLNNKINILIWNIRSIRNYTKKIFLAQLLYDKDIHIALIQ